MSPHSRKIEIKKGGIGYPDDPFYVFDFKKSADLYVRVEYGNSDSSNLKEKFETWSSLHLEKLSEFYLDQNVTLIHYNDVSNL
jgi:hypothetical protein